MPEKKPLSRRRFLKAAAAAGAATLTARNAARAAGANERLATAFIGCGHIATQGHLKELAETLLKERKLTILAACDVYRPRAVRFQETARQAGCDLRLVDDYREILALRDLDYVTIATPEH